MHHTKLKRILSIIIICLLVLTACGNTKSGTTPSSKPTLSPTPKNTSEPTSEPTEISPQPSENNTTINYINFNSSENKTTQLDSLISTTDKSVEEVRIPDEAIETITDLSLNLLNISKKTGVNTLVSPMSIIYAIGAVTNGADANTLEQIEKTVGINIEDLNNYLYTYKNVIPTDNINKVNIANSIWFRNTDRLHIREDFIQQLILYYNSESYISPFDQTTVTDINNWVSDNTDGMIDKIIDELTEDDIIMLLNALSFDAEWQVIYDEIDIHDDNFTNYKGDMQDVELMFSEENVFIMNDNAKGFIKYYNNWEYAFVALLPNEGTTTEELLQTLNGESLQSLIDKAENKTVYAYIPKFKSTFETNLNDVLITLGIIDAFDKSVADFSKLGYSDAGNISIDRVIHKTFIDVDERGTKAGAVTAIAMTDEAIAIEEIIPEVVRLDRPFVYMIMDCSYHAPIFIGTLETISGSE